MAARFLDGRAISNSFVKLDAQEKLDYDHAVTGSGL